MIRSALGICLCAILLSACQSARQADQPQQTTAAAAKQPADGGKLWYLNDGTIDRLTKVLPDQPVDRGPISRGEGDLILALQGEATAAGAARAKSEETLHGWAFVDVIGPGFTEERMPLTGALMRQAESDSAVVTSQLKKRWARQRPPLQDNRVTAIFGLPKNDSYPSGHAVRSMMWARILSVLAPEKEKELLQRARLVAYDRVIADVHYPTDVAAGMSLGNEIATAIIASPAFQADLVKAKKEWPPRSP